MGVLELNGKLFTKNFFACTFANFFLMVVYYLLAFTMAGYALDSLKATPAMAGLASSIYIIGALVARLLCGHFLDKVGHKRMLLTGVIANLVITLFYFILHSLTLLFLVRFMHGFAYGIASTAIGTMSTAIIPKERRGEGIGYYMLSFTVGSAIGPFLGMFLIAHGSYTAIFSVCAFSAVMSLVNALLLNVPESLFPAEKQQTTRESGFKITNFFELSALPICILTALIYFSYSSVLSFLSSFAKQYNLVTAASFFFIVYSAVILISRPFTGKLFDTKGDNSVMYPSLISFTAGMLLLGIAANSVLLLLSSAFVGFGIGVVQACGLAIAIEKTPRERYALANSTFYIFMDLGVGIGPVILGTFLPHTGYHGMYFAMAVLSAACIVYYFIFHGSKATRKEIRFSLNNNS
jgi:MFS family permease